MDNDSQVNIKKEKPFWRVKKKERKKEPEWGRLWE